MYFEEKISEICSFGPITFMFRTILDLSIFIFNSDKKHLIFFFKSPKRTFFAVRARGGGANSKKKL